RTSTGTGPGQRGRSARFDLADNALVQPLPPALLGEAGAHRLHPLALEQAVAVDLLARNKTGKQLGATGSPMQRVDEWLTNRGRAVRGRDVAPSFEVVRERKMDLGPDTRLVAIQTGVEQDELVGADQSIELQVPCPV